MIITSSGSPMSAHSAHNAAPETPASTAANPSLRDRRNLPEVKPSGTKESLKDRAKRNFAEMQRVEDGVALGEPPPIKRYRPLTNRPGDGSGLRKLAASMKQFREDGEAPSVPKPNTQALEAMNLDDASKLALAVAEPSTAAPEALPSHLPPA